MKVRHRYHQTRICNSWVAIIEQYVQIKLVTTPRHGLKFTYLTGDACNGVNPTLPNCLVGISLKRAAVAG